MLTWLFYVNIFGLNQHLKGALITKIKRRETIFVTYNIFVKREIPKTQPINTIWKPGDYGLRFFVHFFCSPFHYKS
jgi:hypothetical protein